MLETEGTIEVQVETPPVIMDAMPSAPELWRELLETKHREHIAHMDTMRAEFNGLFESLSQRISDLDDKITVLQMTPEVVVEDGMTLDEALETVVVVGETVADLVDAVNGPEEPTAPVNSGNHNPPGPDDSELQPDVEQSNTLAPPANQKRRGSRFW